MSEECATVVKGNINIGDAVKSSFQILKANLVLLIVTTVLTAVISGFTCGVLLGPMMMGMFVICDKLVLSQTPKAEIGDLFKGFSFIIPGIVLEIVGGCGSLICGIGELITLPIAVWAMMRIVDTGMSLGDAVKDAFQFVFKEKNFSLILVYLLASILSCLGAVLCGIGIFLTLPLLFLIPACAYRQVYPQSK